MQILVFPVVFYWCETGLCTMMEGCRQTVLTLFHRNVIFINTQCDAVKTECQLKLSARNMQSNVWLFKSLVLCTVHCALNSGA